MRRIALVLLLASLPVTGDAATWSASQEQVPSPGPNATLGVSSRPAVADPDGNVHLVFQNRISGDIQQIVYLKRLADGTWDSPVVLSSATWSSLNPAIARDAQGGLHVVYEAALGDGDIMYRRRTPEGEWLEAQAISPAPGSSAKPLVAIDAFSRVHITWRDTRNGSPQILYCVTPIGEAFGEPRVISLGRSLPDDVTMAADGLGAMHIAWADRVGNLRDGLHYDVFYLLVPPGQEHTATPSALITGISNSSEPYLAATSDGSIHLVWLDNRPPETRDNSEIFYQRYLAGIGWGKPKRFTYTSVPHGNPVIVESNDGSFNIAWEDYSGGNPEIFFRQITHATGWDPASTRLTVDPSSSTTPHLVALPSGEMVLFWTDALGTGDFRVYSKTGTVTGP